MTPLQFFGEGLPYIEPFDCPGLLITIEGTDGVGRTTQVALLREWLEVQGFGVIETGWTRSQLIGRTISQAKEGRLLNPLTYSLLYAADFADRLEKEIIPALRSGFVVLADRYVFTAIARDVARGLDRQWVRDLFGFAPVPHLVLYLKIDIVELIRRVIPRGVIDYFESGMDLGLGADPYDSFKKYQTMLLREYQKMADEFGFHVVNARWKPERIHMRLREIVTEFIRQRKFSEWGRVAPSGPDEPKSPGGLFTRSAG
ncbi:MAG: dTMP kinase [Planctomycetota bacterium]|nr:MAG: dTMP kinase [Planctomycetota bacterium]